MSEIKDELQNGRRVEGLSGEGGKEGDKKKSIGGRLNKISERN